MGHWEGAVAGPQTNKHMETLVQTIPFVHLHPSPVATPRVLRVVHSIHRERAQHTFNQRRTRMPKELFSQQLSAWERDYLNWYHGDPLKRSLTIARKHSQDNRAEVLGSSECGCFHCGARFAPQAIDTWVRDAHDDTAFCPSCDIDAVLGDASGYALTDEFLAAMKCRWYGED
jgi:hypothetical protein